ncbi:hypothetical protein ACLOJK_029513 [Asimina triloba]
MDAVKEWEEMKALVGQRRERQRQRPLEDGCSLETLPLEDGCRDDIKEAMPKLADEPCRGREEQQCRIFADEGSINEEIIE